MIDPAKMYRQHLIQTESLPDVFIAAYDQLASILFSAALAAEARDIEKKTAEVNRALTLLFHLRIALDFERGGEVAGTLDRFYRLVHRDIVAGSSQLDAETLRQAAQHVIEVRKVWEQALAINPQNSAQTTAKLQPAPASPPLNRWTA